MNKDLQSIRLILKTWVVDLRLPIMATMRASGCTYQEIADTFGITKQAVHQQLERLKCEKKI